MSKIISARISGLLGSDSTLNITFNDGITTICGPNGCGKTSVLKILASAMKNDASLIESVLFDEAWIRVYSHNYHGIFESHIKKSDIEKNTGRKVVTEDGSVFYLHESGTMPNEKASSIQWNIRHISGGIPKDKLPNFGSWFHRYLPVSRLYQKQPLHTSRVLPEALSEKTMDEMFSESLVRTWRELNADIAAKTSRAQRLGIRGIIRAILSNDNNSGIQSEFTTKQSFDLVQRFYARETSQGIEFANFDQRYKRDSQFRRIVSDIVNIEGRIEEYNKGIDKFKDLICRLWPGKTVQFDEKAIVVKLNNGLSVDIQSLSSGEKQIIRILLECVLAEQGVLLIDEPELSMHVTWQTELLRHMTDVNPNCQIIAATHSPEIISHLDDVNIFVMEKA